MQLNLIVTTCLTDKYKFFSRSNSVGWVKYSCISILVYLFFGFFTFSFASEATDAVSAGAQEFQQRCALCHGDNGRGNGPYAFALVYKPSDLTTLAKKNNGNFPFLETYMIIDGRELVKSHGPRLMPIWGDRYTQESWSEVSPDHANSLARGKIFELLLFLNSIQESSGSK